MPCRAVSVLLVDFSCAIKLSTPLTMHAAMREASTKGVLIKGSACWHDALPRA